jgi:hypothetical protein
MSDIKVGRYKSPIDCKATKNNTAITIAVYGFKFLYNLITDNHLLTIK